MQCYEQKPDQTVQDTQELGIVPEYVHIMHEHIVEMFKMFRDVGLDVWDVPRKQVIETIFRCLSRLISKYEGSTLWGLVSLRGQLLPDHLDSIPDGPYCDSLKCPRPSCSTPGKIWASSKNTSHMLLYVNSVCVYGTAEYMDHNDSLPLVAVTSAVVLFKSITIILSSPFEVHC